MRSAARLLGEEEWYRKLRNIKRRRRRGNWKNDDKLVAELTNSLMLDKLVLGQMIALRLHAWVNRPKAQRRFWRSYTYEDWAERFVRRRQWTLQF